MAKTGQTTRGRATRARIVAAARELFADRGWVDTTMASIADAAGVAVQTLYLSFGSKAAILAACHDVAVAGDDEPVPVLERPWVETVRSEADAAHALSLVVDETLAIVERAASVRSLIRAAAADPEIAELDKRTKAQRHVTLLSLAELLTAKPGVVLSTAQAADVLYAFISDELHHMLVVERGWTTDAWRTWVKATLTTLLLRPQPAATKGARTPLSRRG